jgi:hypothetical protein
VIVTPDANAVLSIVVAEGTATEVSAVPPKALPIVSGVVPSLITTVFKALDVEKAPPSSVFKLPGSSTLSSPVD